MMLSSPSKLRPGRIGVAVLVLGAVAAATGLLGGSLVLRANADDDGCLREVRRLSVVVTPEIAPATREAAAALDLSTDSCLLFTVTGQPAVATVADLAADGSRPDVWIPDSSIWARQAGADRPRAASVALSPVVLALPRPAAQRFGWPQRPVPFGQLIAAAAAERGGDRQVRLGLPDPQRSPAAVGAVLAIEDDLKKHADAPARLASALLDGPADLPTDVAALLGWMTTGVPLAVPASEQAVVAHNAAAGEVRAVAAYPDAGRTALDYPFVVLADTDADRIAVARLLRELRAGAGAERLRADGFRAPEPTGDDTAPPAGEHPAPGTTGVDPRVPAGRSVPTGPQVDRAARTVRLINLRSRLLTVIDVSGSMGRTVSGAGGRTRMDLTQEAAALGLAAYPDDSDIGLWAFSTDLTETGDYRQLVPIGPLGPRRDGRTGRALLARALGDLRPEPDGGTGLYDTTLAAVRKVREGWVADRMNAVLLLTDGRNDDSGIPLGQLLATLRQEADPARPVPVITVAYGPGSDAAALQAISKATGGLRYLAQDPDDIQRVLLDAIGRRPCRPGC